ncbi:CHAT domain-containing protein (plasmid) [Nocardia sp. CWNU-33]|uniref:CHAT domain-containing protein n=1 Tax=Nocardia sp. CWNU-33 TaxID=3392117 RepID=UPI00398EE697
MAALKLGMAFKLASIREDADLKALINSRMGLIENAYQANDIDESKDAAVVCFEAAAAHYKETGQMTLAAICYTNAVNSILSKANIDDDELIKAAEYLDFSFENKTPDSVEWAYSLYAQGMMHVEVSVRPSMDRIDSLIKGSESYLQSIRLLRTHEHNFAVSAAGQLGRTLLELIEAMQHRRMGEAILDHASEFPAAVYPSNARAAESLVSVLESNPESLGFPGRPDWFNYTTMSGLDDTERSLLDSASMEIGFALADSNRSNWHEVRYAHWYRSRIRWAVHASEANYAELIAALGDFGGGINPSQYFNDASFIVQAGRYNLGKAAPLNVLRAAVNALQESLAVRSRTRKELVLRRQAAKARFIACELCEHGAWREAIEVLESVRGLLYNRATSRASQNSDSNKPQPTWVYMSHSPSATYVIVDRAEWEEPQGIRLKELDGKRLMQLTSSFSDKTPGLIPSQAPGMSRHLAAAVSLTFASLQSLTDVIVKLVPADHGICLVLSGQYAHLPVSSALLDNASLVIPFVTVTPDRKSTEAGTDTCIATGIKYRGLSAMAPPEGAALNFPDDEIISVGASLSARGIDIEITNNATSEQFISAFSSACIVHFSGHSTVDLVNPLNSAIVLMDRNIDIEEICATNTASSAFLCFFSSCSSGRPSTLVHGDEYLGVQSSALYAGFRFSIGSLWHVRDLAAAVFAIRFADELSSGISIGCAELSAAICSAQRWMRAVTADNLNQYLAAKGLSWRPASPPPPTYAIFSEPRDWAAFYLASRVW